MKFTWIYQENIEVIDIYDIYVGLYWFIFNKNEFIIISITCIMYVYEIRTKSC